MQLSKTNPSDCPSACILLSTSDRCQVLRCIHCIWQFGNCGNGIFSIPAAATSYDAWAWFCVSKRKEYLILFYQKNIHNSQSLRVSEYLRYGLLWFMYSQAHQSISLLRPAYCPLESFPLMIIDASKEWSLLWNQIAGFNIWLLLPLTRSNHWFWAW